MGEPRPRCPPSRPRTRTGGARTGGRSSDSRAPTSASRRGGPTGRRFPGSRPVLDDGGRSHSPLRGSPGLAPGSLLPQPVSALRAGLNHQPGEHYMLGLESSALPLLVACRCRLTPVGRGVRSPTASSRPIRWMTVRPAPRRSTAARRVQRRESLDDGRREAVHAAAGTAVARHDRRFGAFPAGFWSFPRPTALPTVERGYPTAGRFRRPRPRLRSSPATMTRSASVPEPVTSAIRARSRSRQ